MTASSRAITRPEWGGISFSAVKMGLVSTAFLHHTVTRASQALAPAMRDLEAHALSLGHRAIDYTNTAFAYGARAVGRGYGVVGGHTLDWNSRAYGQAAIGDYRYDPITEALLDELAANFADGVRGGFLTRNFSLRPHYDVYPTACPARLASTIPEIKRRTEAIVAAGGLPSTLFVPEEDDMFVGLYNTGKGIEAYLVDGGAVVHRYTGAPAAYGIPKDALAASQGKPAEGLAKLRLVGLTKDELDKAKVRGLATVSGPISVSIDANTFAKAILDQTAQRLAG